MRQIGTLPKLFDVKVLTDHLLTLGMTTRVDEKPDGWDVWVYNEDQIPQARQELEDFQKNPDDPRYHVAEKTAKTVLLETKRLDKQYRKNVRDMAGYWDRTNIRRRPLTVFLVAACILVFLLTQSDAASQRVLSRLSFFSYTFDNQGRLHSHGLDDIQRGEVWRLVTPIFIHYNAIHILFNMWALMVIGTLIEYRRDTRTLAALVFLSAIASNTAQYAFSLNFYGHPVPFGGMSGVVYALFGYVWMKGRHEPQQGMILHPSSIRWMLIWLVLCMTGALGPIANAAHLMGLVVGVLFGLARF